MPYTTCISCHGDLFAVIYDGQHDRLSLRCITDGCGDWIADDDAAPLLRAALAKLPG